MTSNPLAPLLVVAVAIVLGGLSAVAIVRTIRRKSYQRWPRALRWLFLAIVAVLVGLGAIGLAVNYLDDWGPWATAWLLIAPIAYGIWQSFTARPSSLE